MYKVNDLIVYGHNGVCVIESIGVPGFEGADKSKPDYTIRPIYAKNSVIYAPVDNVKIVMRRIVTDEEVEKLVLSIPSIETIEEDNHRVLAVKYENAIKTNDCSEWVKIIKTVYEKKQNELNKGKKVSQIDKRYMKLAEDLLYGELAVTLDTPKESVEKYIFDKVNGLASA